MDFQSKIATSPLPTMSLCESEQNSSMMRAQIDQAAGHSNASMVGMTFKRRSGQGDCMYQIQKSSTSSLHSKNVENDIISHDSIQGGGLEGHQASREPVLSAYGKEKTFNQSYSISPDFGSSSSNPGVKIQPFKTSSDFQEDESPSNPLTSKGDLRIEPSAQTETMQMEAPTNWHLLSGVASSPLEKNDAVDEKIPPAAPGSGMDKARSKRPITEIPDINEELPGLQPALSSTDSKRPSTSRVSLNSKFLFSFGDQTSRSEFNTPSDCPVSQETTARRVKHLKLASSDSVGAGTQSSEMGDATSLEKFNIFFNRNTKCKKASFGLVSSKHQGKEEMVLDPKLELPIRVVGSSMGSKNRNHSTTLGCSWIQRWSRRCIVPRERRPELLVKCKLQRLKLGLDDLAKKQLTSVAAMALMWKATNGVRPCEFRRRGPVLVWNTQEY